MAVYRLMDGLSGRPGSGPANANSYTGNFISAAPFYVTQGGIWFQGYWYWVAGGSPAGPTAPQKFALWQYSSSAAGSVVSGSVVTSGTLTAGQWNYVPLATPVQMSIGSGLGGCYLAETGVNGNFNDTNSQFGTGDPYNGLSNGPLAAGSAASPPAHGLKSQLFGLGGSDPAVTMVTGADSGGDGWSNFWLDVQVSDTAPAGYAGSYRLWPDRTEANADTVSDSAFNYVIATEVHLSRQCTLNNAWYWSPSTAAQLATRAGVYSITGADSGTEVAVIASPSWSGAAGSGWVKAAFAGGTTLAAGSYKVYVYNSAASPDQWSATDLSSAYWASGEGSAGITSGPLNAPQLSAASTAYVYNQAAPGSTPPFTTGATEAGQCTFAQTGGGGALAQYPYLYADGQAQVYWVDLEVTPVVTVPSVPPYTASMSSM